MKRRLTTKLLLASLAIAPLAAAPTTVATAQSVVSPGSEIVLSIGRGELVNVPGTMADIFVADDNVADVQVKSQRQLYVFGKAGGETTIYASNRAGDIIWSANVRVGSNIGSIDQLMALAMPDAKISVATMGTNVILLTGTVAAPEDAERRSVSSKPMSAKTRMSLAGCAWRRRCRSICRCASSRLAAASFGRSVSI